MMGKLDIVIIDLTEMSALRNQSETIKRENPFLLQNSEFLHRL